MVGTGAPVGPRNTAVGTGFTGGEASIRVMSFRLTLSFSCLYHTIGCLGKAIQWHSYMFLIVKILYRGLDTKCIVSASPNHLNSHIIKDREIFASSLPEKGSNKIIVAKTREGDLW